MPATTPAITTGDIKAAGTKSISSPVAVVWQQYDASGFTKVTVYVQNDNAGALPVRSS